MSSAVKLERVSKHYHRGPLTAPILSELSLRLATGERLGLVGQNGSGKTTLLRIVLGIEAPDAGTVDREDHLLSGSVGYVPQDYRNALFPWLRLSSNLKIAVPSQEKQRNYEQLASRFRLDVDLRKHPFQLSGGEQQLFLLIRTLLAEPALLVLDEPLSAVDFGRKRLVCEYLGGDLARRSTLVFATHDFDDAVMLSDRVIILSKHRRGIKAEVPVKLPWPRTESMRQTRVFQQTVEHIIEAVL